MNDRKKTALREYAPLCVKMIFWTGNRSFISPKARSELMLYMLYNMYIYIFMYLFFPFWNFEETIGSCIYMSFNRFARTTFLLEHKKKRK